MRTHVFTNVGLARAGVTSSALPGEPAAAAAAIDDILRQREIDTIAFWDAGAFPWSLLEQFRGSLDDAWVACHLRRDVRDILRHAEPVWIYRASPRADVVGAVSWQFDARAAFVRASVLRDLGGLDSTFDSLEGAMRELGLRLVARGAVCRQQRLTATPLEIREPSLADQYRLLRRRVGRKWVAYSFARRVLEAPSTLFAELRAWRGTAVSVKRAPAPTGVLQRDLGTVTLAPAPRVSVILPTFGRYRYVAEVLDDLRAQSIRPTQILIADGNPPDERRREVYEQFRDLPLEILWHEQPGICSGRNACLARASGDYVWFVDDDSRFDAHNLENHLRTLAAYGADVSVGPAYTKGRPELAPEQRETACGFMDCGTTVCRRELLAQVGGFDMQYNMYLRGEDNDLGIRFVRAGGLMLNNPSAQRFHYLAPVGGSRSKGSVHVFRRWSLLPRPVQSIYYLARRHFEPSAAWDSMIQNCVQVGWKRPHGVPATRAWRARTLIAELAAAPLTLVRLYRSFQVGRRMVEQGPLIPSLSGDESRRSSAS